MCGELDAEPPCRTGAEIRDEFVARSIPLEIFGLEQRPPRDGKPNGRGGPRLAFGSLPTEQVLTRRELGRATLARQLLLERSGASAQQAVEQLVGLQAQDVPPPYIALWSRLDGFRSEELTELCRSGRVVRASLMRHTVHLVTTRDYVRLHGAILPALVRSWRGGRAARLDGLDVDAVVTAARDFVAEEPRRFVEIQRHLADRWPDRDPAVLAYTARTLLPMMRVTDGDVWAYSGNSPFALADPHPEPEDRAKELVLRYLAAFGPATPADAGIWSGRSGLKAAFEELRPRLVTFSDEGGRELFDLPDAPRPPADTPAPPRLLPVYDNLLLSHKDRTRVIPDGYRPRIQIRVNQLLSAFLVDGEVAGVWIRDRKTGRIELEPFRRISKADRAALEEEAGRLEEFLGG
jgi:hypothetical protein